MARRRMIAPEIWESEDFASLSLLARLLFIGLFSNADDEGRGRAKAAFLKSRIFPYDENIRISDITKACGEIARHTSIVFYEHDENEYYSFKNWCVWQSISRPTPSRIPPPDEHSMKNIEDSMKIIEPSMKNIEDSLNVQCKLMPKRKEKKGKEEKEKEKRARAKERFAEFWSEYPRKVAKAKAEQAWEKFEMTEELFNTVMNALKKQKLSRQWKEDGGRYIPHPATWINQKRWEDATDAPDTVAAGDDTLLSPTQDVDEIAARFLEMYE